MARKKPINKNKKLQNMGGHLIMPPKFCNFRKRVGKSKYDVWVDLTICHSYCPKQCRRYKWFCNATGEEKRERWKKYNVKNWKILFRGWR